MTDRQEAFDVAIIGFGPSGATLAHLLGLCGLRVLVLERDGASCPLPRAVHLDDEVMRVFQTIGLGDALAAETLVNPGMRFVDREGRLLLDWSRPQSVGRHGWHPSYRFHQPSLERMLNHAIARSSNVELRRRCEAFLIDDRGDDVVLRYEDMSSGSVREVRAAHVVGCDGARSLVRRFIGSELEDYGFHERWLVVDVILTTPRPDLGDHSVQHCDPERSVTYTRQPGDRRRWEFRQLPGDDVPPFAKPERVWPLLSRWITPDEAEIERVAAYTFHSLVAKQWRRGRLWIAGDAAHQTPPFMGQGMCAGIRDVANLAWKLALSIRANGDDALLDSYQAERLPNVTGYITTAVRLGGLINATDPEAALRLARRSEDGASRMDSPPSELGAGLGTGPAAGRIFGQMRLADGRWMDDLIGYSPVLVVESQLLGETAVRPSFPVITTVDAPGIRTELECLGARAALVRPDRYVLATASDRVELECMLTAPDLGAVLDRFSAAVR